MGTRVKPAHDEQKLAAPSPFWGEGLAARQRERMRAREPAVDRDRLAVHVGGFIARQERGHGGNFFRIAVARERIELPDLLVSAALAGALEDRKSVV